MRFSRALRSLVIVLSFIIAIISHRVLCLKVIYNKPFFYDTTTPENSGERNYPEEKSYLSNLDQFDYLDEYEKKDMTTTRRPFVFTERIKPPVLKVYLKNVTVKAGQLALLKCPLVADENNSNFNEENNPLKMRKQFSKISFRNSDIHVDEFYTIKAIIWTHELTPPKLLSNNDDLFVKNQRISIHSVKKEENDRGFIRRGSGREELPKKEYNLKICPTKLEDRGWYSCSIVRRSWYDQNMKYFIYLNVVEPDKAHEKMEDGCELPSATHHGKNKPHSTTRASQTTLRNIGVSAKTESSKATTLTTKTTSLPPLITSVFIQASSFSDRSKSGKPWRHGQSHNRKQDEAIKPEPKPEVYQLNGNRLIMDDSNKLLDSTLKRELDKKNNSFQSAEEEEGGSHSPRYHSFESLETDIDEEKEIIFDRIESLSEHTTAQIARKKMRKPPMSTTPVIVTQTPSIAVAMPSAGKSRHQPKTQLQNGHHSASTSKESKEELAVYPKQATMREFKSFQLDCVYKGRNYLKVKLIWLKDDRIIQPVNSGEDEDRLFLLNYKQNNTSFCILKFSHALLSDTGVYTCIAISPNHVPNNLHDSDRLLDFRNNLNESLRLLVSNDHRSLKESIIKSSSYFDSNEQINNNSNKLKYTSYFWLCALLLVYFRVHLF